MSTDTTTVPSAPATDGGEGGNYAFPEAVTPGYDGGVFTVPVESCCGVFFGEEHDCPAFVAEALDMLSRPIVFGPSQRVAA